jgi:hypothetical protein
MMKKILVLLVITVTAAFSAGAQGLSICGRLGAGFGMHGNGSYVDGQLEYMDYFDETSGTAFVISGYGAYYFTEQLAVQAELNFMINQSKEWSGEYRWGESAWCVATYSSLDIPILFKYEFLNDPVILGLLAGPHLSFTLGKVDLTMGYSSEELEADGIQAGLTIGLFGGIPLGPGWLIGDLRFLTDFSPLTVKDYGYEVIRRMGINLTVGYELAF